MSEFLSTRKEGLIQIPSRSLRGVRYFSAPCSADVLLSNNGGFFVKLRWRHTCAQFLYSCLIPFGHLVTFCISRNGICRTPHFAAEHENFSAVVLLCWILSICCLSCKAASDAPKNIAMTLQYDGHIHSRQQTTQQPEKSKAAKRRTASDSRPFTKNASHKSSEENRRRTIRFFFAGARTK
jgi:hypothetical protein